MHVFEVAEEKPQNLENGENMQTRHRKTLSRNNIQEVLAVALSISITLTFSPCLSPLEALHASIRHP